MTKNKISFCIGIVLLGGFAGCSDERDGTLKVTHIESLDPCRMLKNETSGQSLQIYVDGLKQLAQQGEPCAKYGLGTLYTMGYESILDEPRSAIELPEEYDSEEELLSLVAE